ncbi:unnamed protein product [Sphenostylis stenocarpa]|uniref:Uncharacterized protein n=1 Tax=Sphenostylis stenocarpa TaxID=92480 RepID=A0AA86VA39_9FABA|nr:unnamed protein product [Sphenostylis stenocarpa]
MKKQIWIGWFTSQMSELVKLSIKPSLESSGAKTDTLVACNNLKHDDALCYGNSWGGGAAIKAYSFSEITKQIIDEVQALRLLEEDQKSSWETSEDGQVCRKIYQVGKRWEKKDRTDIEDLCKPETTIPWNKRPIFMRRSKSLAKEAQEMSNENDAKEVHHLNSIITYLLNQYFSEILINDAEMLKLLLLL